MKKMRVCFALALALVLAVSALGVPVTASAAPAKNEYGIRRYVAIGESVVTGMNDHSSTNRDSYGCWENGFAVELADRLGLIDENSPKTHPNGNERWYYTTPNDTAFQAWAFPALRTREIRHWLDPEFEYVEDDFVRLWLDDEKMRAQYDENVIKIRKDVTRADLVTLSIGGNDLFISQLQNTAWALEDPEIGLSSGMVVDLVMSKLGFADAPALPETVNENEVLARFLALFAKNVVQGYNEAKENYPKILEELRELNPEAQIVVIGEFNPLHDLSLTDGKLPVRLGEILDGVFLPLNLLMISSAAEYDCDYVSILDVPTDSSFHPTDEGYQQIADRIQEVLRPATPRNLFEDVDHLSSESREAIDWAVKGGITTGTSDTTFSPDKICTRGQIVTFLYRAAGSPAVPEYEISGRFTDVRPGAYYADAVTWAVESGITNGKTATTFAPDETCSRAQIVTFLYRWNQVLTDAEETQPVQLFDDVKPGAYYAAPVTWAAQEGVTSGLSARFFGPSRPCTRAQAVTFLYRYARQLAEAE